MLRIIILALVVVASLATHAWTTSAAFLTASPAQGSFSGTWEVDAERSDDPDTVRATLREACRTASGGAVRTRAEVARGGREGQRGGGRRPDADAQRAAGPQNSPAPGAPAVLMAGILDIAQAAPIFVVTIDRAARRRLFTDNRGTSVSARAATVVSTAGWEGGRLYVETRTDAGARTIERYTLLDDGSRLEVQVTLVPSQFTDPIVVTRVFRRSRGPEISPDEPQAAAFRQPSSSRRSSGPDTARCPQRARGNGDAVWRSKTVISRMT